MPSKMVKILEVGAESPEYLVAALTCANADMKGLRSPPRMVVPAFTEVDGVTQPAPAPRFSRRR